MQKEMGNQNTSGILAEEKNENGLTEKVREISSSDGLKEENKILIQENENKHVQEKAEESDNPEAEADQSCPVEELTSSVKEFYAEVANGSVNEDYETRTSSLDDVPSNLKESDLEKGMSKLDNDVHDQPCTLNEEKQESEFNFEAKSTSISSLCQEAVDITSEPPEDHKLLNENDEKLGDNPPQDEQNNSFDAHNDLPTISLQDLSAAENEKQDEVLVLDEEKPMMNESVNEDNTTSALEEVLLGDDAEEKDQKFLESNPSEDLKDTNEVTAVLNEVGLVQSISMAQDQEEEKPTTESSESGMSIVEECATLTQSLLEIEKVNEFQLAEGETRPILDKSESKGNESEDKLSVESNLCYNDHKVELRKSPSFDFGIPLDPKSQESDQTPLLYQDRPPMRSFSSCSGMRFQNRSVQTEYLGKSLHCETVEVEEKTIRMERNHSESLRTVAKEEQGNLDADCDVISPKGNGKRKPRSSLFTTCICCTAAIS